jgi:hypothetical protein
MKLRHKFCIFVSFKFNIKVFDRFENRFAQKLLTLVVKEEKTIPRVLYRFLVFSENGSNPSFYNEIHALIKLIKYRQLRTLLSISDPFSESEDFYEVSRFNLLFIILKNFNLFRFNLVKKLSLENLDFVTYSSFESYPKALIGNKYLIKKFQKNNTFLIEKKYTERYKIKILQTKDSKRTLLDDFISWNSFLFIRFIREHKLEEYFSSLFGTKYGLINRDLVKFRIINVLDHQMSNATFDEIYKKNGLNYYVTIPNAEIWHQRFIFVQNLMINLDATASPRLGFVAGIWSFIWNVKGRSLKYEILSPYSSPIKIKEAIYLMGRVDENWYHFLLDTAPRILFLDNVPKAVPVLIRNDLPQSSKDFLKALTTREVIEIDPTDFVAVEILYVLPGKSTIFDSRPPRGLPQVEFSPEVLSLFRSKVLECLPIDSNGTSNQRISFRRKSVTRNVVNWGKIRQELENLSFDDIPLDSNFYSSQVQIFSNSNIVVSPGGAVLANIIFMNPGSKVVALTSFRGQRIDLWRKLSDSLDLKYIAVKGIPTYWGFRYLRKLHSNFYISPKKLRRILSREI